MPIILEGDDIEDFENHDRDWVKAPSKEAPVFDVEKETTALIEWIKNWFEENGKGCNAIIGLSGGKDSTVAAALCAKALGPDRVIGVSMPDSGQSINEADEIAKYLGIRYMCVPIGEITNSFKGVWHDMGDEDFKWSDQATQNIPPRIRMTVEYALAQTYNGRPSCNCNLSEDYIGYATLGGDSLGSFAPLSNLTVTEIKKIGHYLGLPEKWVEKIPDDGLPHSSPDEEKFGFTYAELDRYIRTGICEDEEVKAKIVKMHKNNTFKTKMIQVPSFKPSFMEMSYAESVIKFE
jgi:NAD+ synthase